MSYNLQDMLYDCYNTDSITDKLSYIKQCTLSNTEITWLNMVVTKTIKFYVTKTMLAYPTKASLSDIYEDGLTIAPTKETIELLTKLADRSLSGNAAVQAVMEYYIRTQDHSVFFAVHKDLRCGLSSKTLLRAGVPLDKWEVQKGVPYVEGTAINFPLVVQPKYNGNRLLAWREGKVVHLRSYNGSSYKYQYLQLVLSTLPEGFVLDGELINGKGQTEEEFKSVNRRINSAISGGGNMAYHPNDTYLVWDVIPLSDFMAQRTPATDYSVRMQNAQSYAATHDMLKACETSIVNDREQLNQAVAWALDNGYEGIVGKDLRGTLTYKKDRTWLKFKRSEPADLRCISAKEHTTKAGQIGALLMAGTVKGKPVQVWVGSGLNDADRCVDYRKYIGKIFEVTYFMLTHDSVTGAYSLNSPRFKKDNPATQLLDLERHDK